MLVLAWPALCWSCLHLDVVTASHLYGYQIISHSHLNACVGHGRVVRCSVNELPVQGRKKLFTVSSLLRAVINKGRILRRIKLTLRIFHKGKDRSIDVRLFVFFAQGMKALQTFHSTHRSIRESFSHVWESFQIGLVRSRNVSGCVYIYQMVGGSELLVLSRGCRTSCEGDA